MFSINGVIKKDGTEVKKIDANVEKGDNYLKNLCKQLRDIQKNTNILLTDIIATDIGSAPADLDDDQDDEDNTDDDVEEPVLKVPKLVQ